MYKVLIVDDEVLLRVGLRTTINWEQSGFTVVAEATNGEQGYEQYKKHEPDVVITDIKMPKKDGLWLIETIRSEDEHIPILVLTCHDEFAFARQALKAGADDYILKSEVEDEELIAILNCVKKKLDKTTRDKEINQSVRTSQNDIRRTLMGDLIKAEFALDENLISRLENTHVSLESTKALFTSVSVPADKKSEPGSAKQINKAVINLFFHLLDEREISYLYQTVQNQYHFLLVSPVLNMADMKRIFFTANQGAQQYFDKPLRIIYSDIQESMDGLFACYKNFLNKTEALFYLEEPSFYLENVNDIRFDEINKNDLKQKFNQMLLIDSFMRENEEGVMLFVGELMETFRKKPASPNSVRLFLSELINHIYHQYSQMVEGTQELNHEQYHFQVMNASTLTEACGMMERFLLDFIGQMNKYVQRNSKILATQALNFIQQNFDRKISLKDVAEHLNLSKHYLCSVFKKETGDNVSYYINKLRIEKAKMLLHNPERKSKEIFEEVGYSNQQYFSKVFKKLTGLTVLEYKEKITPDKAG